MCPLSNQKQEAQMSKTKSESNSMKIHQQAVSESRKETKSRTLAIISPTQQTFPTEVKVNEKNSENNY